MFGLLHTWMPAAAELVAGRTAGRSGVAWNAEQKTHASSNRKVLIAACLCDERTQWRLWEEEASSRRGDDLCHARA